MKVMEGSGGCERRSNKNRENAEAKEKLGGDLLKYIFGVTMLPADV
jgi:hypothetical protein